MAIVRIGRYEVVELLGQGGMGAVYLAKDPLLDRDVAIKVIHPKRATVEAKERFLREARAVARLDSPYIVKVFDIGVEPSGDKEMHYIVMERVLGRTLSERIEAQGPPARVELQARLRIYWQLLQSVLYAHQHGVVHRDLKPDNVMITSDGRVKIMDFGLATLDDSHSLTRDDQIMGTLAYFAPEQARGGKGVDHRADIYALGVILFELCSGDLPFMGTNPMHMLHLVMNEPPPSLMKLNPNVPGTLEKIVVKSLAKNPDHRQANVGEMLSSIEAVLRDAFHVQTSRLDELSPPTFEAASAPPKFFTPPVTPPIPPPTPVAPPITPRMPELKIQPPNFAETQTEFLKRFEQLRSGLQNKVTAPPDPAGTVPDLLSTPAVPPVEAPAREEGGDVPTAPSANSYSMPFLNRQGAPRVASSGWMSDPQPATPESPELNRKQMQHDQEEQEKQLVEGDLEPAPKRQTCAGCGSSQPIDARKCLDCGHALNPSTSYFVIQREALELVKTAKTHIREGRFEEAAEAALAALDHDDGLGEAHLCLGRALVELRQLDKAESSLEKAAELLPDSGEPYLALAEVCMAREDLEGVIACLLEVLQRRSTDVESRCRLAFLYSETGRSTEAIEQYKAVLRTHPRHLRANRQLGLLFARLNRDEEAIRYLELAHKVDPDDAQSITLLGRLYARRRQFPLAQEAFQAALSLRGEDAALRAELGALYQVQNREEQAMIELRRAIEHDQGNREARLRLAGIFEKHGHIDRAVRELEAALRFHPQDLVLHRRLGELYLQRRDLDRALQHFEDVVKLDPLCAEMHNRLGQLYLKKDYTDKSIEHYRQAVELHKLAPEYREDLAMAFYCQGDLENALRELHKAQRLDGTNAEYIKALGILYLQIGNVAEAKRHLLYACEQQPNDAQSHGLLAQTLQRQGLTNMAITEYAKALELDPSLHVLHLFLARALAAAGRHAEAIQSFRNLSRHLGRNDEGGFAGEAYVEMGQSYLAQGLAAQAEEVFHLARKRNPNDAEAIHGLARVALHRKQFARARDYLSLAIELEPKNSSFVETLAGIQGEEGNWGDAVLTLQRALTENPADPDLYEHLGRAQRKADRLTDAASTYRRAAEVFPARQWRFFWLEGRIEARRERWGEAAALYRRALDRNTGYAQLYIDLAQACHQLGETREALEVVLQGLEVVPESKLEALRRLKILYESELGVR